jgi:hypothetical protein
MEHGQDKGEWNCGQCDSVCERRCSPDRRVGRTSSCHFVYQLGRPVPTWDRTTELQNFGGICPQETLHSNKKVTLEQEPSKDLAAIH